MAEQSVLLVGDPHYSARLSFIDAFRQGFVLYWAKSLDDVRRRIEGGEHYTVLVIDARHDYGAAEKFCRFLRARQLEMKVVYLAEGEHLPPRDCADLIASVHDSPADFLRRLRRLVEDAA